MNKILWRKNLNIVSINYEFKKGELYNYILDQFGNFVVKTTEGNVTFGEKNMFDYFYSPEETKNILRDKTIEKMLKIS